MTVSSATIGPLVSRSVSSPELTEIVDRHWTDGVGDGDSTGVYPVFAASNLGDGHTPSGIVSNADPSAVPTVCDGSGVSVSGQDEEQPAIPATAPDTTVPRNVRRNVEGINYGV
ncbi:hypothetical protein [Haloarcula halophila]|uniref:hypothetical protein n=1 Tax=Haloarcula halophila TaxID=3032584 RepID=UPI0023E3DEB6|nr:hypothetical protein [Halomicroarcula sp. DFY41]